MLEVLGKTLNPTFPYTKGSVTSLWAKWEEVRSLNGTMGP